MKKHLKSVISLVVAIAMVFAGMQFTTVSADVDPEGYTALESEVATTVGSGDGAWELKANNTEWGGWSQMSYKTDGSGTSLGDTTMRLDNSPNGVWGDVEYGMYARLKNAAHGLVVDMPYKLKVKIKAVDKDGNAVSAGKLITQIEGKEYKINVASSDSAQTVYSDQFDHDQYATVDTKYDKTVTVDDVTFYLTQFPTGTYINISEVTFEPVEDYPWTPVPTTDLDKGDSPKWADAGALKLMAMHAANTEYQFYGKLKYQKTGDALSDSKVLICSTSGWLGAYSVMANAEGYLDGKLEKNEDYTGELKFYSSKAGQEDPHGGRMKLKMILDGKEFKEIPINEGMNTYNIESFTRESDNNDVQFELEGFQPDSVFYVESLTFTKDNPEWKKVPNGVATDIGIWKLFARTGETQAEGQWGALSYKKNVPGDPEDINDIDIKVRSSSGWHGAWATMGTLKDYMKDVADVQLGHTYNVKVTYTSNQASSMSPSGDQTTVLASIDKNDFTFPLIKGTETVTIGQFTFEENKDLEDGRYDVIFNWDEVAAGTELHIENVEFEEVNDGWTPVDNNKYKTVAQADTNDEMQVYARMGTTVAEGSWGKMSYKYAQGKDASNATYKDLEIKNRTTSGWYVSNNPANLISFPKWANGKLTLANKYKVAVTVTADRDPSIKALDGTGDPDEKKNDVRIMVDGKKKYDFTSLPDGESITLTTDEFTYEENSPELQIIMDMMSKKSTIKIEKIEVIPMGETDWSTVPNDSTIKAGAWYLYAKTSSATGSWGQMLYTNNGGTALGDTTINCYSTSGWFGAWGMLATLNGYADGKMTIGENYSTAITIDSSADITGKVDEDDPASGDRLIKVRIDNQEYTFPAYKGTFTYVIPKLQKGYTADSKNVQFDLDTVTPQTVLTISDIAFGTVVSEPKPITAVNATASGSTANVTWEQVENTIYVGGSFNVYVDNDYYATVDGNVKSIDIDNLTNGSHKVEVKAVLDGVESAGMSTTVVIGGETTEAPTGETDTQAPTQAPTGETDTQAPTQAPTGETGTQAPTQVTTKAADVTTAKAAVKVPGKATVKKAVKKKSAKKFKVTLKKVAGATKYQVAAYKTKKNAKKNKKALVKKTITKLTATIKSKKIKKLKVIYVRARAWNTAGYGAWGGIKKSKKK